VSRAPRSGHDDETPADAKSCGAGNADSRTSTCGVPAVATIESDRRHWQITCYGGTISLYAPRTLDGDSEMCKLRFRHGDATKSARRRAAGFSVPAARGRVFLRALFARPFGGGIAPRHRRSRAGAGEMGQGNRARAAAAAVARTRGAVSAARPGDFREFDRARLRETETSVAGGLQPPRIFRRVDSVAPLVCVFFLFMRTEWRAEAIFSLDTKIFMPDIERLMFTPDRLRFVVSHSEPTPCHSCCCC
jgi:hypothetical protein